MVQPNKKTRRVGGCAGGLGWRARATVVGRGESGHAWEKNAYGRTGVARWGANGCTMRAGKRAHAVGQNDNANVRNGWGWENGRGWVGEQMNGWANEWAAWLGGWVGGWMGGWVRGWLVTIIIDIIIFIFENMFIIITANRG